MGNGEHIVRKEEYVENHNMQKELIVGNTYYGFRLVDKRPCPDYRGDGYLFRHEKTKMEVYFLSCDNTECFFSYTIYTPPEDDTGVFHILEHTVLTGSRKYPVRDPFMALNRNSCNTFLNAMTAPDRTDYPAASPVKKDFDNIFSIYTDAVFDPLLRKEDFMQEGIRISSQGGLHFEGVVFSEMLGDISNHNSVVQNATTRPLYNEDSPYNHEFGGNPPDITDLTYEKFIATYKKYYVPGNMTLFLYGDLDVLEKLEFLDREYLSKREGGEKAERATCPEKWDKPRKCRFLSSADEDDNTSSIMVSWLLGEADDPMENTILSLVVDVLLGNPGSPLYKRIVESGIGRDISSESGLVDSYRNLSFSVGFSGSTEDKADEAEAFILKALGEIIEEGIDSKCVESSLRRMEFKIQEISDGLPEGYRIYFTRIDKGWAYGKNPSDMLQTLSMVGKIREEIKKDGRFVENWIKKNLIDNTHRLLSVITMDKGVQDSINQEIQNKLELHKKEWNEEDERLYLEFEEGEDAPEDYEKLPRLNISDIPSKLNTIPREVDGKVVVTKVPSASIVYSDIAFDVSDFPIEDLEYVSLLSRVMLMTDVGDMDYSSFLSSLRFVTGAFSAFLEIGSDCNGEEKDTLIFRFKSLSEHFGEALDLLLKLLKEGKFSSPSRVKAAMRDIESDYEASVVRQAHSFALGSASRSLTSALYTTERTEGLMYWYRIGEMLKDGEFEKTCENLSQIAEKTFTRERVVYHLTLDGEEYEEKKKMVDDFILSLPKGGKKGVSLKTVPEDAKKNLGYSFSSPVTYSALSGKAPEEESEEASAMRMLLSMVSNNALWSLIREKGGAYGAGAGLDINEDIWYFYTYRDPRLEKSIGDFSLAVKIEEITDEKLEDAKLKALSRDTRPTGPQSKGILDLRRYIYGISDELRQRMKDNQLKMTKEDIIGIKRATEKAMENGCITVLGGKKALENSNLSLEIKALPFAVHS